MVGINLKKGKALDHLIVGITKWIHKWKKNGWKLVDGKDVINKDDFLELDAELDSSIKVSWVGITFMYPVLELAQYIQSTVTTLKEMDMKRKLGAFI